MALFRTDLNGKIFNDDHSRFLFLDFLPKLFENIDRDKLLAGTFLGNTIKKKVKVSIELDSDFERINPIEHVISKEGILLKLKISNPEESIIVCEYELLVDYILIEESNVGKTNEVIELFKNIMNEPIILKNKS